MRAATLGKTRGPHSLERSKAIAAGHRRYWGSDRSHAQRDAARRRMNTPTAQSICQIQRWGKYGNGYVDAAVRRLEQALRRRRGGAPAKDELHIRWLAMFEGNDEELEEMLVDDQAFSGDRLSRIRTLAWLDWQRHPDDWPRDRWFASPSDGSELDPELVAGAGERVRKGLQTARKKLTLP